ncbi:MAG: twin-arginine translocation signal domain-containing protein [Verrucomicrobiota bacterium]|nr:twin-arginine translocation signal domain-containing protein [Verrucomicrobiota bacterium]
MKTTTTSQTPAVSRRHFLKTATATGATVAAEAAVGVDRVFAAESDVIRVGLVGCGARGVGAAMNCVLSSPGVEIVALGDVFADRVEEARKRLLDDTQDKEWSCCCQHGQTNR